MIYEYRACAAATPNKLLQKQNRRLRLAAAEQYYQTALESARQKLVKLYGVYQQKDVSACCEA